MHIGRDTDFQEHVIRVVNISAELDRLPGQDVVRDDGVFYRVHQPGLDGRPGQLGLDDDRTKSPKADLNPQRQRGGGRTWGEIKKNYC